MTQRTIDLFVKVAIEIVEWINILLKEKRRPDNHDSNRTTKTQ
jgi:hypothetical protein